jgi:glycerol-3-phosphate acyltransferase PlsY
MDLRITLLAMIVGYLCGAISFARLITQRVAPQADLTGLQVPIVGTEETSPVNVVGANTASMILGPRYGCLIAVLDMAKVAVPMLAFKILYPDRTFFLVVAVAGLVGHNWPIFFRFRGGRGFSVIFAGFVVADLLGAVVTPFLGMLLGMIFFRNVSVAYIAWLWLMIPWLWFRTHDRAFLIYAVVINLVFILAVLPEIRMLLRYRREGKLEAYMQGLMGSSPRWRGMTKIANRLRLPKR